MEGDALVLFHYQMIFSFLWKSVLVLGILLWAFSDPEDDDDEDIHHGPL